MKKLTILIGILMFIALLILLVTPAVVQLILAPEEVTRGSTDAWRIWSDLHQWTGWFLTGLMVLHIILCFPQILAISNFGNFSAVTKMQYLVMFLVFISMTITIITGAIWGNQGGATQPFIRIMHGMWSWFAFLITGLHIGLSIKGTTSATQ
jgi:hypothetical protein